MSTILSGAARELLVEVSLDPTAMIIRLSAKLTARIDVAVAREALDLGALAYVDKPFDLDYSSAF